MDPANPGRLLLGTNRVYVTTDRGDNWAQLGAMFFPGTIRNLAAAADGQTIYVSTGNRIFVTTDNGSNWTEPVAFAASFDFADIQVDLTNAKIAYAVTANFNDGMANG